MINLFGYTSKMIAKAINGTLIGIGRRVEWLSIDTREKFKENTCFFAIKGEHFDGNEYVTEAIRCGAKIIVTEKELSDTTVDVIQVKDTTLALGLLASFHIEKRAKVIAITGSTGKTTTKDMIISVLKQKYKVCGTEENQNNEIGVALTLLKTKEEDFCVIEMGMRGRGQIDYLTRICKPYISIVTNCGTAHIELLGSKEHIFYAKMEIMRYKPKYAVVPSEKRFKTYDFRSIKPYFIGKNGDLYEESVDVSEEGISFVASSIQEKKITIKLSSCILLNVQNALFAIQVGRLLNVSDFEIQRGLESYKTQKMRGEVYRIGKLMIINDCYNASFEGTEKAIFSTCALAKSLGKSVTLVLGDMLELGDFSQELHFKIGRFCKIQGVERIIALGKFSNDYLQGFGDGKEVSSIAEITELLKKEMEKNQIVLIKASRNMRFEKIINEIEREVYE